MNKCFADKCFAINGFADKCYAINGFADKKKLKTNLSAKPFIYIYRAAFIGEAIYQRSHLSRSICKYFSADLQQ